MIQYETLEPQYLVLREDKPYSFSDYFKMGVYFTEVAQFHGYDYRSAYLTLARSPVDQARMDATRAILKQTLPFIELSNEQSRREFLISPVMQQVVLASHARIRTEYQIRVNDQLFGTLDYHLQGNDEVVVVEAKRGDLSLGFTQLTAELIALDQWKPTAQTHIVGAVSVGDVWQFGVLDRAMKLVSQDLEIYTVPNDLEAVVGILTAALVK